MRLSFSRLLVIVGILAVVAVGLWYGLKGSRDAASANNPGEAGPDSAYNLSAAATTEDSELHEVTPEERASAPRLPAIVKSVRRATPPASGSEAPPRVEPSPQSRQVVASLTNLDFSHGPITAEQAQHWKQNLQALTAQGAAAVPAIREFLSRTRKSILEPFQEAICWAKLRCVRRLSMRWARSAARKPPL